MPNTISPGPTRRASPARLKPIQLKALEMIVAGKDLSDVAQELGVTRQTVSEWKNRNTLFRAKLDELIREMEDDLRSTAPMRHQFVVSQLVKLTAEGPHESRLKAIQCFLDRVDLRDVRAEAAAPLTSTEVMILRLAESRAFAAETGESSQ
ncbi:phBC6A51 family helix-turn-helix protein [Cognatilysobacter tabacisoli]|uniref:phBC6A51 family helix-turn-helix protein n=1 Tax=Cognatilysobacter tabacisoli TaxID=2315424 RepID=UPI0018C8A567|nr:phBC6A51 family helix-turn-helix protein [Lysobacter tabacisoli]